MTQSVSEDTPFELPEAAWIRAVPLRTPTLPPATHTNCYVVGQSEAVALIDPATPYADEQARFDGYLGASALTPAAIVLTHHHGDHIGDAARLQARYGVPVWAHAATATRLGGRVTVQRHLADGERLPFGPSGLRVRFTPGHAPGHLALVDEAAGAIVVGDLVASRGTILVDPADDGDMTLYLESLRALQVEVEGGATCLLPAHGPPIRDAATRLAFYLSHRLEREQRALTALGPSPQPLASLVPVVYADLDPALYGLATSSLLAHLVKLEREGRARRQGDGWLLG